MVLDSPPRHGYKQQSYTVAQTGYTYPQAGSPYSTPSMGMGYNSTPVPTPQYQNLPMGYGNSHPYGHGHGHGHQHNGMTTYSAGAMGYGGNPCPPVGPGYGPGYTAVKYDNVYSTYKGADD